MPITDGLARDDPETKTMRGAERSRLNPSIVPNDAFAHRALKKNLSVVGAVNGLGDGFFRDVPIKAFSRVRHTVSRDRRYFMRENPAPLDPGRFDNEWAWL